MSPSTAELETLVCKFRTEHLELTEYVFIETFRHRSLVLCMHMLLFYLVLVLQPYCNCIFGLKACWALLKFFATGCILVCIKCFSAKIK